MRRFWFLLALPLNVPQAVPGKGKTMESHHGRTARNHRLLRLALMTAVGVVLLGAGAVAASGRSSSGPSIAAQTTTTTTQTTTPTTIRFSFSVKTHKGRERTRATGQGTLTLAEVPQTPRTTYTSTSGTGVIRFHRWKVLGHHVLDEDDFSMDVSSGWYRFNGVATSLVLHGPVTKAASITTDLCSPGSAGAFGLGDGKVKSHPDFVGVEMCGVRLGYANGIARARVVVTVKIEPSTG
jgi:hypothetical protein